MPSWIPRWHPGWWAFIIIAGILIWKDPAGWGHRVGGWIGYVPVIADHIGTFVQNI